MGGESLRPVGGSEGMRCSVDVGRPPPGPRPVLWPPANFSPQCTQLMSSSQQSRAECWQQSRESNCCQVSPSLPTGSAASRGGGRRKDCQFEIFNCGLCDLKGKITSCIPERVLYPRSIKTREVSRDPRDVPREISRAEGVDFPIVPKFWCSTAILFITPHNPTQPT